MHSFTIRGLEQATQLSDRWTPLIVGQDDSMNSIEALELKAPALCLFKTRNVMAVRSVEIAS